MTADPGQEFASWIKQQQEFLERLTGERDPEQLRKQLDEWWRSAGTHVGSNGQELAAKLLELGQTYLQGLQQFAASAASATAPDFTRPEMQQPFSVGADLMTAWRNARLATDYTAFGMTGAAAAPWLDAVGNLPPIGPGREYIIEARQLAAAHDECQRLEQALADVLRKVQTEALEALQARVTELTQAGEPPQSFRQLYDVWIECGERAYSKTAHSGEFAQMQADFANALMRLRGLQRKVVERSLRKLDLPTRAELNTVHLKLRELRRSAMQPMTSAAEPALRAQARPAARKSAAKGAAKKTTRAKSSSRQMRAKKRSR